MLWLVYSYDINNQVLEICLATYASISMTSKEPNIPNTRVSRQVGLC